MRTPGRRQDVTGNNRCRGLTLLEMMIVMAIIGILFALGMPEYQKYQYRSRAAGIVVESAPIKRAIDEYMGAASKGQYRPQLANGTDRSILGCVAPAGVSCGDAGAGPAELVVPADKLLISRDTVRVVAARCEVDCPSFALSFTSDLNATGTAATVSPPATSSPAAPSPAASPPAASPPATTTPPATPPAAAPAGKGNSEGKGQGKGKADSGPWLPLVASAYAQSAQFEVTNRVLYEFGEVMRKRVHSSDNATCLVATGPCTVTIKF